MAKLKRPSMMMFLKVDEVFQLAGVYSEDLSISYNAVTEESQDVTEVASTTDVTGYSLNIPVSTKVVAKAGDKGYELSAYIQKLRRMLATAGDAETEVLLVDAYEAGTKEDSFVAQQFRGTIQIDTYGGPASESLGTDYTVNINGEPTDGEVVLSTAANGDKTAVFTASV